jgi:hypothetical protein
VPVIPLIPLNVAMLCDVLRHRKFVEVPEHYLYSNAGDYYTSKKGLIDIGILESLVW